MKRLLQRTFLPLMAAWIASTALAAPLHAIFVIDGTHARLKLLLGQALYGSLAELENAPEAWITVVKVCNTVNTVYNGPYSGDALRLYGELQKDLSVCTTRGSAITAGLERALTAVQSKTQPSVILYLTDGGTADDHAPKGKLEAVGKALSAQKNLKWLWVAGLGRQGDLRQQLVERLSVLERKGLLHHSGMSDIAGTRDLLWNDLF